MKRTIKLVPILPMILIPVSLAIAESEYPKTDSSKSGMTADDQKLNEMDTRISAQIRKDIMDKKGMSMNGKNIKIISQNGNVTLRGEVEKGWEKEWIETCAKETPHVLRVRSELKEK